MSLQCLILALWAHRSLTPIKVYLQSNANYLPSLWSVILSFLIDNVFVLNYVCIETHCIDLDEVVGFSLAVGQIQIPLTTKKQRKNKRALFVHREIWIMNWLTNMLSKICVYTNVIFLVFFFVSLIQIQHYFHTIENSYSSYKGN